MKAKYLSLLLCGASVLAGCSGFLDVNPKGETFDNDMFTTASGYEDAIYGIYSEAANGEYLYAGYLQWVPEAMCQNISCENDYKLANMQNQEWEENAGPKDLIKDIWTGAYKCINHINNLIDHVEAGGEEEFEYSRLYKGEMLAMRALLHFELLRLICPPAWAPAELKQAVLPYVRKYSFDITPFSSLDEAYALILQDLKEAERCLEADKELVAAVRDNVAGGFTSCRTTHLNLYAVQALIARVLWNYGKLDEAAAYAEKVISSGKFSFRPVSAFVQPDNGVFDRNETIFGLYSLRFNMLNFNKYSPLDPARSTYRLATDWKQLYEQDAPASGSDYRLNAWFNDFALVKLVNQAFYGSHSDHSYTGPSIPGPSLLRLPEMYFIVAEANLDTQPEKARAFFDQVISSRGLETLAHQGAQLTRERLFRERRKEFYGEGFSWYEMKREGMDVRTVLGVTLDGRQPSTYTIEIPRIELENRENINKK